MSYNNLRYSIFVLLIGQIVTFTNLRHTTRFLPICSTKYLSEQHENRNNYFRETGETGNCIALSVFTDRTTKKILGKKNKTEFFNVFHRL